MADYDVTLRTGLDTKDVEAQANKLRGRIEDIFNKTNGKKMSSSMVRLKQNLRDLYMQSKQISAELAQLDAQKFELINTQEYNEALKRIQTLATQITKIEEKMRELDATGRGGTTQYKNLAARLKFFQDEYKFAQMKAQSLESSGKATTKIPIQDTQHYQDLVAKQAKLNDKIQIGVLRMKEMQNATRQAIHPFREMYSVANRVRHVVGKIASGIRTLINRLRGVNTNMGDTQASMRNLLKFALKYGLGLRSIFILYKRIRSAGVEAYKGLASQFPELQEEVNQLKIAFFQLKNSLATMAQPILSYLVPAIKTLMGWLVSLMNTLANFFAILTGQKYIYKAAKTNNALADSIKGTGKAAKEANEDIAEYDNLILIQQDNNNGGGGGGGDLDQYAGAWEKVAAESDFAQQLKDAINRGDWEGVGDLFAQKLNGVVNRVDDWINNVLRPEGTKWAERIGKILNGLTAGFDAKKFGQTVADAVNAIFDIANTFLTTYNFLQLGEKVGTSISSFFKKVDLNLVGTTLANKLNATIDFLTGLLKKLEFKDIGNKIGQGLKKFLETIKFEDVGADLSRLANGILESLSGFLQGSDLGKTVGTAINNFLNGINFAELATNLSELAFNLLKQLANAISTIDWYEVGKAIADFLTHIDWMQLLVQLGEVALNLIKGLAEAIIGLISNPEALLKIAEALALFFGAKFIWGKVTGAIASGLGSALTGGTAAAVGSAGGGAAGAVGAGASAGGGGVLGNMIQSLKNTAYNLQGSVLGNILKGAGYGFLGYEGAKQGSKLGAIAGGWIAQMMGAPDELVDEYLKEAENPLKYMWENLGDIAAGFGQLTVDVAKMAGKGLYWLFGGVDEVKKDALIITDTTVAAVGVVANVNQQLMDSADEVIDTLQTDSNHYAEIAKQNAGVYDASIKQAEENSNHYVEIAKQNSGYYDKIQKEMEASSDHYVAIAKANAQTVALETTESLAEVEKASVDSFRTLTTEADNTGFELITTFTDANTEVMHSFDGTEQYFNTVAEGVKKPFGDMGDFFTKTFGTAWEDTVKIFQSNSPEFTTIQDRISGTFTGAINSMIGGINNTLVKPFSAFNNVMAKLKEVSVGGSKLFASLPSAVNIPTIPKLAQGAVLPPNQPFLAMVGDQKQGTNVEAPLDTIAEALRQVLSERQSTQNPTIVLQLNGNQIAQAVWNEESKRYKQTGVRYRQA